MRRLLIVAAVLVGVGILAAGGAAWWFDREFRSPGPSSAPATVVVPSGASVAAMHNNSKRPASWAGSFAGAYAPSAAGDLCRGVPAIST
jgi:hypothetical protein